MSRRPAPAGRLAKAGPASASRPGQAGPGQAGRARAGAAQANGHGIPDATVARLPVYLRALNALAEHDVATVSSEELAAATGVNSAKLRKDLSHLGSYGTRGVGYDVEYLVYQVSRELGLTQDWPVLIVGAGNLGRALANYGGFASRGFRIAALLDRDPEVVGTVIAHHTVRSDAELELVVEHFDVSIGVIATPATAAQNVGDRLVAAGVTSILNFAPVVLSVPSGVDVRKVDLSIELQILAFHAQRRSALAAGDGDQDLAAGRRRGRVSGRELDLAPAGRPTKQPDIGAGPEIGGRSDIGARPDVAAALDAAGLDYRTGAQAVGT